MVSYSNRVLSLNFPKINDGIHHHHLLLNLFANNNKPHMDIKTLSSSSSSYCKSSHPPPPPAKCDGGQGVIGVQEWQAWGTTSPLPAMVSQITHDLKALEQDNNTHFSFGRNGGKIQGELKIKEDKKHREKYQSLADSEQKIQFFSARQVACRLLGSRGYLCQKCWLPLEDCMCSGIRHSSLWQGIRFWVYMHPKDFLRQNNTGKLLWQVFGVQAASLCVFGIVEQEDIMWNEFMNSGKSKVWCLYPNKNAATNSVKDILSQYSSIGSEIPPAMTNKEANMHFILIDGTWSNSAAMFSRLKDRANLLWGGDLSCISLSMGVSTMHKLRPQPSWDRTCTAAAAVGLLLELHSAMGSSSFMLDEQAEAVEESLEKLLEALTARRLRMGRSITRKVRHNRDIC